MSFSGAEDNKEITNPTSGGGGSRPKPANPRVSYRECLKNHAANIGGNVTDGCGEFMPGGAEGSLEALNCAACSCHRNFHRKDAAGSAMVHPLQLTPPLPHRAMQPVRMAFGGGGDSSSEELNFSAFHLNAVAPAPPQKRFRTKFTAAQKEKMLEFAEKVGWRIPREDDVEMQRFCAETGVKRQVFKVWMHNNKTISSSSNSNTNKTTTIFPNVN
ncbi:zinc-finger homeodomain protein 6-like [Salvia hispanica]|uniref:zinc-finger homeodomain protein 6-like n=1 Tax=Salvia hispanica TaxID=49212 RepID=UPI002009D507|nr:zinc-finger homeodomain protein 6-like [Salvia hispanica]